MKKFKRKIYVVGNSNEYANWTESNIVTRMEDADLVMFVGGEDVSPSFYDSPRHPYTSSNIHRDNDEIKEYHKALKLGKKLIGICRGSQFLCVMAGGKLIQHMSHPVIHKIKDLYGKTVTVNSSHHQCQFPFDLPEEDYKLLGWANEISPFHEDGNREDMGVVFEPENVYYPKIRALGIQSHPEWLFGESEENTNYFRDLLNRFMNGELNKLPNLKV